jgi:hypothetical protein
LGHVEVRQHGHRRVGVFGGSPADDLFKRTGVDLTGVSTDKDGVLVLCVCVWGGGGKVGVSG